MWLLLALLLLLPTTLRAEAPLSERVLVVFNAYSKDSKDVARHYMRLRHIPDANKCGLKPVVFKAASAYPVASVAYQELDDVVLKPVRKCLTKIGKEKVLYIVLTYDTPYKVGGVPKGGGVSLDSYLSDIWDEVGSRSPEPNPYFPQFSNKHAQYPPLMSLAEYRSQPDAKLIYSVWRLDASTPAAAKELVDRALEAEKKGLTGKGCFDRKGSGADTDKTEDSGYAAGDWDILRAAQFARQAGFEVIDDTNPAEFGTAPAPARCDDAALYAGWYSLERYYDVFTWRPGAIGFHLDSASLSNPRGGRSWSANAIAHGITVTSGALTEPYLNGLPRPAIVFRSLFEGATVGDAFLRGTALLKWQIINVGDPLYAPFPGGIGAFASKK